LKTKLFLSFLLLAIALPVLAESKIGVVDIARVLEASPQRQQATKTIQNEFGPREKSIVEKQKQAQQKEETLMRDAAIMSESKRNNLQRELVNLQREIKRDEDTFREDLNFRQNELLGKIQRELVDIIRDYAKEKKFDLMLVEGVIYASDALDVTDDIIKRLK